MLQFKVSIFHKLNIHVLDFKAQHHMTFTQIILTVLKAELTTYFAHTDCQGHSALVSAQKLSTVVVSLPRQPALQEDSARLPLHESRG